MSLAKLRELIWPLLEKDKPGSFSSKEPDEIDLIIAVENLEEAFRLKSKMTDLEEDRRKSIESKASLFIGTISVATSVVVASSAFISGSQELTVPIKISVVISFVLSIYASRTVWFSVKTLERRTYSVLDINDINFNGDKFQYYRHLINVFHKNEITNQSSINTKVDYFTLAQEYYKRAIITICIYSFFIFIFCFVFKKSKEIKPDIQISKIEVNQNTTKPNPNQTTSNLQPKLLIEDSIKENTNLKTEMQKGKSLKGRK